MKSIFFAILFSGLFAFSLSAQDPPTREKLRQELRATAEPFERMGEVFRLAAEFAGPSIVHIEATRIRPVQPAAGSGRAVQMQIEETGSGIVAEFDDKRVILTNRHVVEGIELDSITIKTYDRRILTPTRVRTNADFDLAVIEVAETTPEPAVLGDCDRVRPGDVVLTVGSPFGLDRSLSMGIVSATGRRRIPAAAGQAPLGAFFQTDAAVNPGSSGGPMLNLRGEVVGLVTAIATQGGGNEGVAFVIPIKYLTRIARQLAENGVAVRPYLGVSFDPQFGLEEHKNLGLDRMVGARINRVLPDSPAAEAGLEIGDVILCFDEIEVEDDLHVVDLAVLSEIDKPIPLDVLREGKTVRISIRPAPQASR